MRRPVSVNAFYLPWPPNPTHTFIAIMPLEKKRQRHAGCRGLLVSPFGVGAWAQTQERRICWPTSYLDCIRTEGMSWVPLPACIARGQLCVDVDKGAHLFEVSGWGLETTRRLFGQLTRPANLTSDMGGATSWLSTARASLALRGQAWRLVMI